MLLVSFIALFLLLLIVGVSFILYAIKTVPNPAFPYNDENDTSIKWFGYGLYLLLAAGLIFLAIAFTLLSQHMGWAWV